jgi:hypothetical protein
VGRAICRTENRIATDENHSAHWSAAPTTLAEKARERQIARPSQSNTAWSSASCPRRRAALSIVAGKRFRSSTDRALGFEPRGCGFKSCRDRQSNQVVNSNTVALIGRPFAQRQPYGNNWGSLPRALRAVIPPVGTTKWRGDMAALWSNSARRCASRWGDAPPWDLSVRPAECE